MPIFEYKCLECNKNMDLIVSSTSSEVNCAYCGSSNLQKLVSAHASISGNQSKSMPGPNDTSCCGSSPQSAGCAGPGSCCGKI
ncbi:MAG: zinc ribbon domain-containing protein [Desulfobacteraceae bacterium]|nr:zinc ribbon domain-containing protein [Desulfobacteraceae bacterium]